MPQLLVFTGLKTRCAVCQACVFYSSKFRKHFIILIEIYFCGKKIGLVILSGEKLDRDIFWRYKPSNQVAYRKGNWKIVNDELYNLSKGIGETTNSAEEFPDKFNQMKKARNAIEAKIIQ